MMWVYQTLDILSTTLEGFCLYVISRCLCKEPRFQSAINKFIPMIAEIMLTYALTWLTELGAWKMLLIVIFTVVILKICYKDTIYQIITVVEVWFIVVAILLESIAYSFGHLLYGSNQLVMVDDQAFARWEIYAIALITRLLILGIVYLILKDFKYKIQIKDSIILTSIFLIAFTIVVFTAFAILNLEKTADLMLYISSGILATIFFIIFMYSKNLLYLREQEQKDKVQIAQLQQQFSYYQEKFKDEEKVRSIYHDMKNHLLVLQKQINSPETAEMVEKLQSQVAMYADYEHTGNDILDIILKEKSEIAREKHIALSVTADLNNVDFIESLDISTIFGNGLDNAIEASEKIPEEQRAIIVKAGKMQNFFSVLIENNCLQDSRNTKKRTTKSDDFLHGFGISNMRKAAEKYDGQLTTKCENGKFVLKILLLIPARLEMK